MTHSGLMAGGRRPHLHSRSTAPRRTPTVRHRPRRIGSAWLAQEEEGCGLNQNTKLDFGETAAKAVFLFAMARAGHGPRWRVRYPARSGPRCWAWLPKGRRESVGCVCQEGSRPSRAEEIAAAEMTRSRRRLAPGSRYSQSIRLALFVRYSPGFRLVRSNLTPRKAQALKIQALFC